MAYVKVKITVFMTEGGFDMNELKDYMRDVARFLDTTAGILDAHGYIIASTDESLLREQDPVVKAVLASEEPVVFNDNRTYMRINRGSHTPYVCFVEGTDDKSRAYIELMTRWIETSLTEHEQVAEREAFLKNVLLENELPGDIPLKAREYKIAYPIPRQVFNVHVNRDKLNEVLTVLLHLFPDWDRDFILPMDEENIVVILEMDPHNEDRTGDEMATRILDAINTEAMTHAFIGVGLPADVLKDTAKSYREASMALIVGNIFDEESSIMRYDKLGLGRLIYQLPKTLCKLFLSEVFEEGAYEALDDETLLTIQKFFENNLNGSETSRQLFVHRNTLVYRLDKVEKITGLDLRNFDDAVLFKLAQMVRQYLENKNTDMHFAGEPTKFSAHTETPVK